ncbi:MAG TPA: ABC-2 transporter permease, partial [Telluria sp.]|nr:ABC-2 transporter permease [Telluria sp.]
MKTMHWLLRREYWEHKGSFFWAPAIVALVMVAVVAVTLAYGFISPVMNAKVIVNGHEFARADMVATMAIEQRAGIANAVANGYIAAAAPLFGVLPFVVFFYCLSALYDDRRDRSILFWKSLPISDRDTVLSKVLTALVLAPVVTFVIGIVTAFVIVLLTLFGAGFFGVHIVGLVLANPAFWLAPLQMLGLLPVYVLWALPTVGYLLLVSAWARSKVFLWAVGVPLLVLVLMRWISFMTESLMGVGIDVKWIGENVVMRGLGSVVPGFWLPFVEVSRGAL